MTLPDWVKPFKTKGIEIRKRGKSYHAYRITSKWIPAKKRSQKISLEYLGVVTPNGIFKPRKQGLVRGDYQYGNVNLLFEVAQESGLIEILQKTFTNRWEQILMFSFLRLLRPLPLKSINYQFEDTYLSKTFDTALSPKSLSNMLKKVGNNFNSRDKLMKELTTQSQYLIIDLTALFSYSDNLTLRERGRNKDHLYIPQINLLLLFSPETNLPTYVRLLPGSIRDVSTVKNTIQLTGIHDYIFIGDRGFFSENNLKSLEGEDISYLFPLKRNSTYIPKRLQKKFDGILKYHDRPIVYWKKKKNGKYIYIFDDQELKKEEETTFLTRLEAGKTTQEKYFESKRHFGKMYLISNMDIDPQETYYYYKDRNQIEYAFNIFLNLLEADKSYLRDDNKFEGYIFINFISLFLYYQVLNRIKKADLNQKYSVQDILLQLSKIKIYEFENGEMQSEIPKKVKDIIEAMTINIDLLRIEGKS
jgi:transposase